MRNTLICGVVAMAAGSAFGATNPFTETFETGPSNWFNNAGAAPVGWVSSGALDGSAYTSESSDVGAAPFGFAITHRGQVGLGASGGAFAGNWIADGVNVLQFDFRHDAPVPVNAGARIASPFNFPAAVAIDFVPVVPNTWTTVTLPITPGTIIPEGSDFNTVFSNVGNIQLGISVPDSLTGTNTIVTIDIDNVTILPTPGVVAPLAMGGLLVAGRRRR